MSKDDLITKLVASEPYQSFVSEQDAYRVFKELKWMTLHGCYQRDLDTGKYRGYCLGSDQDK